MAGTDAQKQLLTLIRDFASEKSQGERRVAGLKKQIEELQLELDAANAELEDTKLRRETAEQELKGYEVELAVNKSATQTLEARISTIQKVISTVRSDLQDLKSKDRESRDEFINKMFELNAKIRNLQKTAFRDVGKEDIIGNSSEDSCLSVKEDDRGTAERTLEDKLAHLITELTKEKEMFQVEQNIQKQVQQELLDLEMKVLLMEAIAKATRDLQDLTRQSSQLEQKYSCLAVELQKRSVCPSCRQDNIEAFEGSLQINEAD